MNEKGKGYALIGGSCFAIWGIYGVYRSLRWFGFDGIYLIENIEWICDIGFACLLFIRKKSIGFTILAGISSVVRLFFLVVYPSIYNLGGFIAIGLFGYICFRETAFNGAHQKQMKKITYILPAIVLFIGKMIVWGQEGVVSISLDVEWLMNNVLIEIVEILGILFTGMWLMENSFVIDNSNTSVKK